MNITIQTHKQPLTIGITGGIGSGKTAVTDFFTGKGITIVDADLAARVVVEPGKPALTDITNRYGNDILSDGQLNRRQLRTIIFDDDTERQWLENLLHPLIREQIIVEFTEARSAYVALVSPLLLETDQHQLVDRILVVDVPEQVQIARTMNRDDMNEAQTRKIISSQMPREERLKRADDVIDNSGTLSQLHQSLEQLHQIYLNL